jgi:hypothetical protein
MPAQSTLSTILLNSVKLWMFSSLISVAYISVHLSLLSVLFV